MCDIVFEKVLGLAGKVNRTSVCRGSRPKGSFRKILWEISQNSQKNICASISFLIKWDSVDLHFKEIESLEQVFFCEICEIYWNAFFAEHHRTTASDCSSINNSEGRISKQNLKL